MTDPIFVFGSNLAGIHGAGAARWAKFNRGAIMGIGAGMQGNSYGIPTKDYQIRTLPLEYVRARVLEFLGYAREYPDLTFQVTCIGCGLAGFKDEEIAPMFAEAPKNCLFDTKWKPYLGEDHAYWGTF